MLNITEINRVIKTNVIIDKVRYFCEVIGTSILGSQDKACPFCSSLETSELMNKFLLIKLFRCNNCGLMFRYPKDEMRSPYYRDARYYEEPKISNALPTAAELARLKKQNFKGGIYDISHKVDIIKKYVKGGNLLDYGAAWGYHLWQFINAGFSGIGYEVAAKRAKFGQENLGLRIITDSKELDLFESNFDIVFANHVLEHIEDIRGEFNRIYKLLKEAGYLFIFVPDCSDIDKQRWKEIYAFGKKHCIAFDRLFFNKNLSSIGFSTVEIKKSMSDERELTVIAKKINR